MINVKITMVNGTEYNIRNSADNVKDVYKRVMAPYGTNMSFVELMPGLLIATANIISIRELSDEEVNKLNDPKVEEVTGLTETEVEVDNIEPKELEVAQ